ncbi:lanthionine synthetase LanC family protein [Paraliomyxa miuraensis]|uniref:lanthionine synthetase LanC family protein n=1 Tax=Paraliomyxa miuraensis TaxID=376150 RepID=UPI00225758E3|nr:lanthionine synthetase LanC family protein [Paraliomyxa miuraensis]MCX4247768.1 hypothetical protein [Paraliomyxa miuraensis]
MKPHSDSSLAAHCESEMRVLDADAAETARTLAVEIARALAPLDDTHPFTPLLFHYLAAEAEHPNELRETAERLLEQRVASLGQLPHLGLYGGATGTAWLVAHITDSDRDPADVDGDPLADFDDALLEFVREAPTDGFFDLICGMVGYGVYFLERHPRGLAAAGLAAVVDALLAMSRPHDHGLSWFTGPQLLYPHQREKDPNGHTDLGVAHGSAGVVYLLAKASQLNAHPRASTALDQAVSALLSNERDAPLPYCAGGAPARVAWCYGDLGVGAALCVAGHCVGEPRWIARGAALAERAFARAEDDDGVVDACLCHGALGNAHIFGRLFRLTNREVFAVASRRDFERGLDHCMATPADHRWTADTSFTTGSLGMALCLLGLAGVDSSWDRLLCLS